MTVWTPETLPPELVALHDAPGGTSLHGLAGMLNAYDAWREDSERPDPAAEYGGDLTAPLCCCKRGSMCGSCGVGQHWQCPDRDDWDDDAWGDDEDEDWRDGDDDD